MFSGTQKSSTLLDRPAFADRDFADAQFNALFHRSPIPEWIFDPDSLAILDVNEAACRRYGYSRAEFLALTIRELRPESDRAEFDRVYGSSERECRALTVRHRVKGGDVITVKVSSRPIPMLGRSDAQLVTVLCPSAE